MLHEQLTRQIIRCAMQVHRSLGNGFQEIIYLRALAVEFELEKLKFQSENEISIYYRDRNIGASRIDFFVADKVMVEIRAQAKLEDVYMTQAMNYLEAFKIHIGLLINFGGRTLEVKHIQNSRLIFDTNDAASSWIGSPNDSCLI